MPNIALATAAGLVLGVALAGLVVAAIRLWTAALQHALAWSRDRTRREAYKAFIALGDRGSVPAGIGLLLAGLVVYRLVTDASWITSTFAISACAAFALAMPFWWNRSVRTGSRQR